MLSRVFTAILFLAVAFNCPEVLLAGDVVFEAVNDETTQLRAIMQKWHDEELKRQGGKFASHGWWPWGLRAFDFDLDGDLDLIASHHGKPGSIIIESALKQTGELRFTNVTEKLGITSRALPGADDRPWIWDINGDGYLDICGLSDESSPPVVLNQRGSKFVALPGASLKPLAHPREILDLNGDGWLDVDGGYRGQWFFDPDKKNFRHLKRPRFEHLSLAPEDIRQPLTALKASKNNRFLRSVAMTHMLNGYDTLGYSPQPIDLNSDGIGDLVIQTSGGYGADYLGHYLIGSKDRTFDDATKSLGLPREGAPIWIDDLTGDNLPDVLIAGKDTGGVYVHDGKQRFVRKAGPLTSFLQKRGPYLLRAFRIDVDNDSDWDIVMTNPRLRLVEAFENLGDGNFASLFKTRGWDSNSTVIADTNNDGKMDIVVGTRDRSNRDSITVFLNETASIGNYLRVNLRMPSPNPFAVGSVVKVFRPGESHAFRTVKARWDGSPIHIGVGNASSATIHVTFADATVVKVDKAAVNTTTKVEHGDVRR